MKGLAATAVPIDIPASIRKGLAGSAEVGAAASPNKKGLPAMTLRSWVEIFVRKLTRQGFPGPSPSNLSSNFVDGLWRRWWFCRR